MTSNPSNDTTLIDSIRSGQANAWAELIARYEGRLLAFVNSRLSNRSASEDIVQETFVGFLTSLPNYDGARSLDSYLFSICSYKLTDHLRREGRRPTIPMVSGDGSDGQWQLPGSARVASSIARSAERKNLEEVALVDALRDQFERWCERGDWIKLKCIELLTVRGFTNKKTATLLDITEQQVANYKFDFLARTRTLIRRQGLDHEVFPELYEDK